MKAIGRRHPAGQCAADHVCGAALHRTALRPAARQLDSTSISRRQLLPDYIEENRGVDWDVVYDDRGHFREPHTDRPSAARDAERAQTTSPPSRNHEPDASGFDLPRAGAFSTRGPTHRFGAILFIEKEGFMPLFEAVQLAERFDLAIMSTKGVSVTAAGSWWTSCAASMRSRCWCCTTSTSPALPSSARCSGTPGAIRSRTPSKSSTSGCGSGTSRGC